MKPIALIAGQGDLPRCLLPALRGRAWQAWHLEGYPPDGLESRPFRIETLGSLIARLEADGVEEVCFAGSIARPKPDPSALDAATLPLVPRMLKALEAGDDGALKIVIAFFEEAGIEVIAPQDLAPDLLAIPEAGEPGARDRADIARAAALHRALAPLDVGQCCVVAGGQVLAIEALPGTDRMLASLAQPFPRPEGGVLFKAAKRGQDRRVDMATIGPNTVVMAAEAGLSGIAVERGSVLVLDRSTLSDRLAEMGLFLTVLDEE